MFYRLSNTASRSELEGIFNVPLAYPSLYEPSAIIDGLKENNLLIRTSDNPEIISIAIWGILPSGYSEQWQTFQNIKNTLNFNTEVLKVDQCFKEALYRRRCVVFVTGFFTTYIINSRTYPYYVYLDSQAPFCLAGVYNELDDGFLSCSILISNKTTSLNNIQSLGDDVPIVLDKHSSKKWLDPSMGREEVNDLIDVPTKFLFKFYPISSNFYTDDTFDSDILKPFIFHPHIVNDFN